jgi:STAS domain
VERPSGAAPPRHPGVSGQSENGAARLSVRIEALEGSASVVVLAGELDLSTVPNLEAHLHEERHGRPGVVVDLTGLQFIDSSGIDRSIPVFAKRDEALAVLNGAGR